MKAVRIHAYGGPEVLVYEDAPRPTPAEGEVLVKVYATSVNPADRAARAGYLRSRVNFALPFIPGFDIAGVVEAVGPDVTTIVVGDAVYGYSNIQRQGAYAEYAIVSASEIAPKPTSLDFITSAAVPVVGLTAWQGLFDAGGLQAGQTVLIHGAGGGIGSFAVQFALAKGARVLATASGDKLPLLRELGVTEAIDYTTTRFEDVAHDVDVVFDTVGGEVQARSLTVLKSGGILASSVRQPDAEAAKAQGVRVSWHETTPNMAQHTEIARLIDAGRVKPVVSTVLPLAEARQAHELLGAGHMRGKMVLRVVDEAH